MDTKTLSLFVLTFYVPVNNFSFMLVHEAADKVNHFPVLSDCRYYFPALKQGFAGDKESFSRTQHSNSTGGEIRTRT